MTRKRKKILIVEDEYIGALSLAELIASWDYEVSGTAETGEEAIMKSERESPDIVLMDISLRGEINGIEAATEIDRRFGIPVIFMSGYEEDSVRDEISGRGPFHFISKPLDFNQLRKLLETL